MDLQASASSLLICSDEYSSSNCELGNLCLFLTDECIAALWPSTRGLRAQVFLTSTKKLNLRYGIKSRKSK